MTRTSCSTMIASKHWSLKRLTALAAMPSQEIPSAMWWNNHEQGSDESISQKFVPLGRGTAYSYAVRCSLLSKSALVKATHVCKQTNRHWQLTASWSVICQCGPIGGSGGTIVAVPAAMCNWQATTRTGRQCIHPHPPN